MTIKRVLHFKQIVLIIYIIAADGIERGKN
jgi:hypothetical protein